MTRHEIARHAGIDRCAADWPAEFRALLETRRTVAIEERAERYEALKTAAEREAWRQRRRRI